MEATSEDITELHGLHSDLESNMIAKTTQIEDKFDGRTLALEERIEVLEDRVEECVELIAGLTDVAKQVRYAGRELARAGAIVARAGSIFVGALSPDAFDASSAETPARPPAPPPDDADASALENVEATLEELADAGLLERVSDDEPAL